VGHDVPGGSESERVLIGDGEEQTIVVAVTRRVAVE